jgi:5-(carboxyamino)imidazole ribonucleotide synthase
LASAKLADMAIVGVVGGGQLARMMIPAATALGVEIRVFAEAENSSAQLAATAVGDYTDYSQLAAFAREVDALTFDHEHVPTDLLSRLEAEGVKVRPGPSALIHAQNKLVMRRRLAELGLPMPAWQAVQTESELDGFLARWGEAVVKTPIGGYDGKGVRVVSKSSEVADWFAQLESFGGELLVEQRVRFARELAVLSARSPSGEFASWPTVQTVQRNGVCAEVIAPAAQVAADSATAIARAVSEGLGVTGVLAVEMFEAAPGELLINELAMRPHNSGHFSIEGSVTSQFEQHLRAVLDWPLGSTDMVADSAVMVNLLGVDDENDFISNYPAAMREHPEVKFHSYQKQPRVGRKMGHLTAVGSDSAALLKAARAAADVLRG